MHKKREGEGREEGTAFTLEHVTTEHRFVQLILSTQQTGSASHIFKSLILSMLSSRTTHLEISQRNTQHFAQLRTRVRVHGVSFCSTDRDH